MPENHALLPYPCGYTEDTSVGLGFSQDMSGRQDVEVNYVG